MNQKLKKDISKVRKEMKHDYEQKIKERAKEIKKLRVENDFQRKNIHNLNIKVDSLEKVKNKIHIKYVDRKKDIKTMDSEQIKKYWNGEFN
jgi:predicted  nucleic acid-binding Zn-ribbon protein